MEQMMWLPLGAERLALSVHSPAGRNQFEGRRAYPLIVICHGFVGSRVGVNRLFVKAARAFENQGFMVLRFDFLGCGESSGDYGSTGLTSMVRQIQHVLDFAFQMESVDKRQVTLLGHSLGGAAAVLTAAQDERIRNLILWSAAATPYEEIVQITGPKVLSEAKRTGASAYLGYALTPKFFASLDAHQPLLSARKYQDRVLVAHGTADEEIPLQDAWQYQDSFSSAGADVTVALIPGGDHTFSAGDTASDLFACTTNWLTTRRESTGHTLNTVKERVHV